MKKMKSIYYIIVCFLLALSSCTEDPIEQEQYKKEVYLVGAYNRLWPIDLKYSKEPTENFFTVSSSGTLNIDKDVQVSVDINEELIEIYNRKFIGELNEEKYYMPLEQSLYDIPSMENIVINHQQGISTKVPIFIQTEYLEADKHYAIPIQITHSTPYEVNETGRKMLIAIKLINDYSGNYQLDGYMTEVKANPRRIQKAKVLTATSINTVRLFYGMNNETDKKEEITTKTVVITISDDFVEGSTTIKKISVKGWGDLTITDNGKGTYNTISKEFHFFYTLSNGTFFEEKLKIEEDKK